MLRRLLLKDLGGLPTTDGRRVRRGLAYRSSAFNPLVDEDRRRLHALGLRHVVDLRDPGSVRRYPDLFQAPVTTRLPIRTGSPGPLTWTDIVRRRIPWTRVTGDRLHVQILEDNLEQLRHFLQLFAEHSTPLVVHCAAGKDRTGVFVAMLHLALGVSREDARREYLAVREHVDAHFPPMLRRGLSALGAPPRVWTVLPESIDSVLDYVEQQGGVGAVLDRAGFTALAALRDHLLDDGSR